MFYKMFYKTESLEENKIYLWKGRKFVVKKGIPRELDIYSEAQRQTKDAFGFKWSKRDTYESEEFKSQSYDWLLSRYFNGDEASRLQFIKKIQLGSRKSLRVNLFHFKLIYKYKRIKLETTVK